MSVFPGPEPASRRAPLGRLGRLAARKLTLLLLVGLAAGGAYLLAPGSAGAAPATGAVLSLLAPPPGDPSSALAVGVRPGLRAPDFRLASPTGGDPIRLSDFRSRPVLINFWASWCGPCRREMPDPVLLQAEFAADGLVVLGVNIAESARALTTFAQR